MAKRRSYARSYARPRKAPYYDHSIVSYGGGSMVPYGGGAAASLFAGARDAAQLNVLGLVVKAREAAQAAAKEEMLARQVGQLAQKQFVEAARELEEERNFVRMKARREMYRDLTMGAQKSYWSSIPGYAKAESEAGLGALAKNLQLAGVSDFSSLKSKIEDKYGIAF